MSWFLRALVGTALLACVGANAQEVTLTARARVLQDEHKESSRAENVVVWLTPIDRQPGASPPSQNLRLTQHNKSFEPHLLVVPVGAVVQFPNRDPFFHNVFSLFEGKRFDLGLYEAGSTRNVSFDRPGISYIFCNIHAEMGAVVIALETPYFAISNHKGEIVIPHVPVGRYMMKVWYETAEPQSLDAMTREITVSEASSTLGLLQISAAPAASAHKNKYGMDYEPPAPNDPAYSHQ
jgi:plastocyanin